MKSIAKNTIFNVGYKLLNMLFPMITSMYLTRVLGAEYLGKVTYAQNILSYFLIFASFGIPTYGTREIARVAQSKYYKSKVFTELFILNFIFTIICSVIFYIFIFFGAHHFGLNKTLYMCVGLALCMNIFNVDWFYSGVEEFAYIATRSFITKILSIVAIFMLIKKEQDYMVYALITSIATTGNYIFNIFNLNGKITIQIKNIDLKRHLKPVVILLITMLASDLYNQIDVTMLGIYYTANEVAFYSTGVKLIRVVNSITMAISSTTLPRMSLMYKNNDLLGFNELFSRTLENIILFAAPSVLGIMLLADKLIIVLFGESFYPTAKVVFSLAILIMIISISYLIGSIVLTATSNEKYLMFATFVGGISNIILNKILIPNYAMIGAACASIIAEIMVFIIHYFFSRRVLCTRLDKHYYVTIILGLAGLMVAVHLCKIYIKSASLCVILAIILGGTVYFSILLICKNKNIVIVKDYCMKKFFTIE